MSKLKTYLSLFFLLLLAVYSFDIKAQEGFIKNLGQWEGDFISKANIRSGNLFLENQGMTWILYDSDSLHKIQHDRGAITNLPIHVVKSRFLNSNSKPQIEYKSQSKAYFNYFLGNNPDDWKSGLRAYKEVLYKDVYRKIDLQVLYNSQGIKYNFIIRPGGKIGDIKIEYSGADRISLNKDGIEIKTSLGMMLEFPPYVYQEIDDVEEMVPANFTLDQNIVGFELKSKISRRHNLIVDPILVFSTFSGSDADNFGFTATYDLAGNGYSGGTVYNFNFTDTKGFPVSPGAYQIKFGGGVNEHPGGNGSFAYPARDCAIHKYSKDGSDLMFGTFLGGRNNEQPHSMIVNSHDNLIILGSTRSVDFPMLHNYLHSAPFVDSTNNLYDIFLAIFSEDGTQLLSSALIGGSGNDGINGDLTQNKINDLPLLSNYADDFRGEVIVDEYDEIYVASSTSSLNFPLKKPFIKDFYNLQSGVVFKMSPNLDNLRWSSLVGTGIPGIFTNFDACFGLALGKSNDLYVAGGTNNGVFLKDLGGHKNIMTNSNPDGYIIRIDRNGGTLMAGTLVGTDEYDQCYMIKTDEEGYPYVYGQTLGDFPVKGDVYTNPKASQFVAKYSKSLNDVIFSTTIGSAKGGKEISPTAFLVDECGKIYVSGWGGRVNSMYGFGAGSTESMPITPDAFQKETDGSDFWLAVFKKDMKDIIYGTYIGGKSTNSGYAFEHVDGGTCRFDSRGIIYHSVCAGCGGNSLFPTTSGAFSEINKSSNCNNALFKFDMDARNKIPQVKDTFFTVMVADELDFTYFGTDEDEDDILHLSFESDFIDGSAPFPHISVSTNPSSDTVFAYFKWKPDCAHLTGDTIEIKVKIKDSGCPLSDSSYATIKILVVEPPLAFGPEVICVDFLIKNQTRVSWEQFENSKYFSKAHLICEHPDGSLRLVRTITDIKADFVIDDIGVDMRAENYCYYFVTENICGMMDTLGFKVCTKEEYESPITMSRLTTITVPDNKNVQIFWTKSTEEDFKSYIIYKGKNTDGQIAWKEFKEITDINDTTLIDDRVDVSSDSYCYRIQVADQCGHISDTSNLGCNIVLTGDSKRWYFDLDWNVYKEWDSGVKEYVLRRSVDTGSLREIAVLNKNNYTDRELDYSWGGYYFQVEAFQNPDSTPFVSTSLSNKIYLIQPPLLHVPTAFSPNGDGTNEIWGFVPAFVKEFNIRVFNRWGDKVFDSDDKNYQWDGNYFQEEPFENVFIWIATYTGWDDSFHKQKGTVTVLK